MNAVIKVGGKQYFVKENDVIFVEKLNAEAGDKVTFDQVLMLDNKVGNPYLEGATVLGEVLKFSNINLKIDLTVELKDIDNHILKSKLQKLMDNYD